MTKQKRRRLEAKLARLEAELPREVLDIALDDFGVSMPLMSRADRRAASALREVGRQLANG